MVRRFTGYFPDPLDHPWQRVLVREALTRDGLALDGAQIDDLPYSATGTYVTDLAGLGAEAWYQLVFVDETGDLQPTEPEQAPPAWAPDLQDVAEVSQGYTRAPIMGGGQRRGTFDASTSPTADEVRGYIATAVGEVRARVGVTIPERLYGLAQTTAMWHAAATVEAENGAPSADADSSFRWKQASYVANLNELVLRARAKGLRLS